MSKLYEPSTLFLVRMWLEDKGDGQTEWQGKVQNVLSGEARCFAIPELVGALLELLPQRNTGRPPGSRAE
jgi:hypothetical protein